MSAAAPAWKESISLDETNKIRISLGLKPLSDSGPSKTSEAMAEDNYAKRQADDAKERDAAALKLRIDKAKNAQERKKQLVGVGLGEDEHEGIKNEDGGVGGGGDLDNKKWVKQQKKRAKELAAKRAKEMEEMDKRFAEEGLPKYGEQDLKGIKVSHGEDDFEEGEDVVLTLKDSRVLDDEDDELHNLNISENTKTADALALKKKGRLAGAYTGYDDEEFEGADGAKKGVLSKYDEEIEGREEGGFRLGGPAAPKKAGAKGKAKAEEVEEKERVKLDLNYTKSFVTDYLQEDEVGFKVKKKKKRPIRVTTDSLGEDGSMDVDGAGPSVVAPSLARVNLEETNLVDDDDLQAALARARREVNKKRILEMKAFAATATPAADSMDIERVKAESEDDDDANLGDDVIVLDDASEFVRNITLAAARAADVAAAAAIKVEQGIRTSMVASKATNGLASIAPVIKAEEEDTPLSEVVGGWGPAREDGEESDDGGADVDMADGYEEGPGDGEDVKPMTSAADEALPATGTEHLVSRGMASTLSILRSQGLIKTRTPEELAADQARKEKEKWLATQRKREVDKEAERQASRDAGGSKDQAQREYENRKRAADEARQSHEAYADYKPVVNLTYHDEFGRDQTPKEAWKQLSHNFHGHGSGTKKKQKRLDKIEEEKKREAMGSETASSALAFALRAEKLGTATMVLSVGNKGAAPIQEEILSNLNKDEASKKVKAKAAAKAARSASASTSAAVFSDIPMRQLPLPASETRNGSPAVRGGFAPVGGFVSAVGGSSNTPITTEKLQIPMSVKRKAPVDAEGGRSEKK